MRADSCAEKQRCETSGFGLQLVNQPRLALVSFAAPIAARLDAQAFRSSGRKSSSEQRRKSSGVSARQAQKLVFAVFGDVYRWRRRRRPTLPPAAPLRALPALSEEGYRCIWLENSNKMCSSCAQPWAIPPGAITLLLRCMPRAIGPAIGSSSRASLCPNPARTRARSAGAQGPGTHAAWLRKWSRKREPWLVIYTANVFSMRRGPRKPHVPSAASARPPAPQQRTTE